MKILPDYLIKFIPDIEAAMEELRLSVIDHAYEMLTRLDIDELTSDDIRHKLELYDIKVENMSNEWLPNGRFYRLYPSIKHHRSRQNSLKAIAKSGGQFEGLWSNDFANKAQYKYYTIDVLRHYELGSPMDGYFYVSGDIEKDARGNVISSALTALSSDILINQAMPAGYTYLYVPWPRPVYPGDSGCFYTVHMLDFDQLHYTRDCTHIWTLVDETNQVYYCADNSQQNRFYCKLNDKYGSSRESITRNFSDVANDCRYFEPQDLTVPASTKYRWDTGEGTPWRAPYWFDYHYMDDMRHQDEYFEDGKYHSAWPIVERGTYYDVNWNQTSDRSKAVKYVLEKGSEKLADSKGVFPTRCYVHGRHRTTPPIAKRGDNLVTQEFTPKVSAYYCDYSDCTVRVLYSGHDTNTITWMINTLSSLLNISDTEYLRHGIYRHVEHNLALKIKKELESYTQASPAIQVSVSPEEYRVNVIRKYELILTQYDNNRRSNLINALNKSLYIPVNQATSYLDSVDNGEQVVVLSDCCENKYESIRWDLINAGTTGIIGNHSDEQVPIPCLDLYYPYCENPAKDVYRFDVLGEFVYQCRDRLGHFKEYRPFWDVNSPIFAMMQAGQHSSLDPEQPANHSLYYWMNLKQTENRPSNPFEYSVLDSELPENLDELKSTIKDNEPPISEITFTNHFRPTLGHIESLPLLYTIASTGNQGDDLLLNSEIVNVLYEFNESVSDSYNPTLEYSIVSIDSYNHAETSDISRAFIIGDPSSKEIGLLLNGTVDSTGNTPSSNFLSIATSTIHTLWFSSNHEDVTINNIYNTLYNNNGSDNLYLFSNNNINLKYNIIGVYDVTGNKIDCDDVTIHLYAVPLENNTGYEYKVYTLPIVLSSDHITPATAAYIKFTVDIINESAPVLAPVDVPLYQQSTNTTITAKYIVVDRVIDIGNGYIPLADVYNDGWIMMKYTETLYYGQTAVTVYYDDFTGTWPG